MINVDHCGIFIRGTFRTNGFLTYTHVSMTNREEKLRTYLKNLIHWPNYRILILSEKSNFIILLSIAVHYKIYTILKVSMIKKIFAAVFSSKRIFVLIRLENFCIQTLFKHCWKVIKFLHFATFHYYFFRSIV